MVSPFKHSEEWTPIPWVHKSFAAHGATQCGFAPGDILQSAALEEIEANASDIDKALNMHLCRCTGYSKIKMAIRSVQKRFSIQVLVLFPQVRHSSLGQSIRVADIRYPNTLYAVPFSARRSVLWSPLTLP